MLNLTAFSLLSVIILAGGLAYHGSLFPETGGASGPKAALMWLLTVLLIALPLFTSVMWVLRISSGARDEEKS